MKSRNWVRLFLSTLLVGAISGIITGFAVKWSEYKDLFIASDYVEILMVAFWLVGVGFTFSIISQMGFFAYLSVHRFGQGMFKGAWNPAQVVLIAFVLFDLIYFRIQVFATEGESISSYVWVPIGILVFSLIIAFFKSRQTNRKAFIPAVFFMFVVTVIEWVPAIRANDGSWLYLMIFPLLICNAYQLLILPKLTKQKS
ncbi:KinB-signaling pathway activation protein [Fredinandcohnia sp. FSL W7-1320]|uniref:KinB-signaling pathway activation protein n=1 Tax=Fredinandcohnia sp. FSL W7-1320 TaxID=2954540 RepID=UPI0030FDD5FD